jgi:hypothetical protein
MSYTRQNCRKINRHTYICKTKRKNLNYDLTTFLNSSSWYLFLTERHEKILIYQVPDPALSGEIVTSDSHSDLTHNYLSLQNQKIKKNVVVDRR